MALEIVRRFVNGAWKTEAAEAGGGSQPVKSFLSTSNAVNHVPLTISAADLVFDYPADASNGSDITLSSDGKTFTLVNDGIYAVAVQYFIGATAADRVLVGINGTFDPSDPFSVDQPGTVMRDLAAGGGEQGLFSVGPMWFTGGDFFTVQASAQMANNCDMASAVVLISRLL